MKKDHSSQSDCHVYSKEEAREIFHRALKDGGWVSRKHARKRQVERGVENNDILNLSKTGLVLKEPELDIKTNQMKYTIEASNSELKIVFTILDQSRVRLITIITD